jgi:hypothetical protein
LEGPKRRELLCRFKRRGLKRGTARALHGRSMGRGPAIFFFANFSFLFLFCLLNFKQKNLIPEKF